MENLNISQAKVLNCARAVGLAVIAAIFVILEVDGTKGILGLFGSLLFVVALQGIFKWLCHVCMDSVSKKPLFYKRCLAVTLAGMFCMSMSERMAGDGLEVAGVEETVAELKLAKTKLSDEKSELVKLEAKESELKAIISENETLLSTSATLSNDDILSAKKTLVQVKKLESILDRVTELQTKTDRASVAELQSLVGLVGKAVDGKPGRGTAEQVQKFTAASNEHLSVLLNRFSSAADIEEALASDSAALAKRQGWTVAVATAKNSLADLTEDLKLSNASLASAQQKVDSLSSEELHGKADLHGLNAWAAAFGELSEDRFKSEHLTAENFAGLFLMVFWFPIGLIMQGGFSELVKCKGYIAKLESEENEDCEVTHDEIMDAVATLNQPAAVDRNGDNLIEFKSVDKADLIMKIIFSNGNICKTVARTWNANDWHADIYQPADIGSMNTEEHRKLCLETLETRIAIETTTNV